MANTGVVEWNDKVYALWEGGKPHELRKNDLNTIGKEVDEVLGQALRVPQMAAHYRVEENKETKERTLIAFSIESQPSAFPFTSNKAAFYEWNEDGLPFYEERGRGAGFHVRELRGESRSPFL